MADARRGRPPHEPTVALRSQVAIGAAAGLPQRQLAQALGITVLTLRKHYRHELTSGAAARRLDVLIVVFERAIAGSTAAARLFLFGPHRPAPEGVKAQRARRARTAARGTEWQGILPGSSVQ